MNSPANSVLLPDFYTRKFSGIRREFDATGNGRAAAEARADLVDTIIRARYQAHLSAHLPSPEGFCVVALGGYGRRELFPHSDVDLLFLSETSRTLSSLKAPLAEMVRSLWDSGLRVSTAPRTLTECGELHQDNVEFSISLLDCRHLEGDPKLFERLREQVLPHLVARDRADLVRRLLDLTEDRRASYGNTIFHLEPNIKETPGGLRDFHAARWLAVISELDKAAHRPQPQDLWPAQLGAEASRAFEFLAAVRSFLHYRKGRDDNQLTYELQDEAAAAGTGTAPGTSLPAGDWMRHYFRHARSVDRLLNFLLDEAAPPRTSLYGMFQDWRSRLSTPDFSVVRGCIYPRQPALAFQNPDNVLSMFAFSARHGLELSGEAERRVTDALPHFDGDTLRTPGFWQHFREILVAPHASQAVRTMHRLGLLDALFPEFRAIDSLVVRDFYHRYTVDAHTLLTLENLDRLRNPKRETALEGWDLKFAEILEELEKPELLYLALLFHDVGKGLTPGDHVRGSLQAAECVFDRLALPEEDRETVRFLIRDHLIMSSTVLRRDIFNTETVRKFTETVGTTERLKMLCLLTYADVKSVNPEALTPWKAEMLWQLYAASSNFLTRNLDEQRVQPGKEEEGPVARILKSLAGAADPAEVEEFLTGFPRRYLLTHTPEEIAAHFGMARRLEENPIQVKLDSRQHFFELTVVMRDRPFLFASLTGTLAAWGMNILKADAFANSSGTVLDTFRFADLFRTLELNPSERERLQQSVSDVLAGRADLHALLRGRVHAQAARPPKVRVPTRVHFEAPPSHPAPPPGAARSTVLEVITHDRPGVLFEISSTLADLGLNIEIALIDTEGQKVIDVFYLTTRGAPLDAKLQAQVGNTLLQKLQ
jgi:[protein-PII] uridylyltransferase